MKYYFFLFMVMIIVTLNLNEAVPLKKRSSHNGVWCPDDGFVQTVECIGSSCSSIGIDCQKGYFKYSGKKVTSKATVNTGETPTPASCPENYAMFGIQCDDERCNKLKLECIGIQDQEGKLYQISPDECKWSPWISETSKSNIFKCGKNGQFITGIRASGKNVDEISVRCCQGYVAV